MASVHFSFGCVLLSGTLIESLSAQHHLANYEPSSQPPHVTLITKAELRALSSDRREELSLCLGSIDTSRIISLGVGHHESKSVWYIVLVWNAGNVFRKKFSLPPKQFHITLSKSDDHLIDKGYQSLIAPLANSIEQFTLDELDHISVAINQSGTTDDTLMQNIALHMCTISSDSEKALLRLADASHRLHRYKLAMLSYAQVMMISDASSKVSEYCLRMLLKCSQFTEWGCLFTEAEWEDIESHLRGVLVIPWSDGLIQRVLNHCEDYMPTYCVDSRVRIAIPSSPAPNLAILPRFFRWIVPFRFALMSTPRNAEDIRLLSSEWIGIRHILTLTEETPLPPEWFQGTPVSHTFLPIPNYQPPSIEQMDLIMRFFQEYDNLPILIHCGGGKGRAGTVAACYIAAFGFELPRDAQAQLKMSASDAISALRSIRPGSIETPQQEKFVHKWCSTVWKRQTVYPGLVPEPLACDIEVLGNLDYRAVDLLILVGLPGSGKSHLSNTLVARSNNKERWKRISQDESGSRSLCEAEIGRPGNTKVILDRCNGSADDRRYWLSLAATWARSPVCIWFDYDANLCESRAQNRANHPTLPPGGRVRAAVSSMKAALVEPALSEGFQAIAIIRSFEAANKLIHKLCPPPTIFKFPRTPHLYNLGAATDDDLILSSPFPVDENAHATTVVITEKIDGANMGISLDANHSFVVQNRSHYITSNSHVQFSKLSMWLESPQISKALHEILGADRYFPERYILFGEWMCATHSVSYTNLPDMFIAFDLYDRSLDRWATRDVLERVAGSRGISLVPVIHRGTLMDIPLDKETLTDLVQSKSLFTDGRVEGVYVKLERAGFVVYRGKVVRGDFIAGNDHWTKGMIAWNVIDRPSA